MAERKTAKWMRQCFACGARFHPVFVVDINNRVCDDVSNHVCKPDTLRKREARLREEFADEPVPDAAESIDEAFEIVELMNDGMDS